MNPRTAGSAVLVFIAILTAVWAALYFGPKSPVAQQPAAAGAALTLLHSVQEGTHTYAGEVETPTPCHTVAAAVEVRYSEPPHGIISITTEPQDGGVCAQSLTKQPFSISFMSAATPEIDVRVDGEMRQVAVVEER